MSAPKHPRAKRLLYILLALFGLYLLFGFILIPALATFLAPRMAKDHLQGRLETGWIGLNPFTGKVSLDDVGWTGPDGEQLAGLQGLQVNTDPLGSVFKREWRVAGISLENGFLDLEIEKDGTLNLLNALVQRDKAPEPESADDDLLSFADDLPPAWLGLLEISNMTIRLTDLRREEPFHKVIEPIDFRLVDLHTRSERESPYQFSAITDADETISMEGKLQLQPLLLIGDLTGNDIRISEYAWYIPDTGPLNLHSGRVGFSLPFTAGLRDTSAYTALANARTKVTALEATLNGSTQGDLSLATLLLEGIDVDMGFDPGEGFSLEAGARLELDDFKAVTAGRDEAFAAFEALTVEDITARLEPLSLEASGIAWTRPDLMVERDSSGAIVLMNILEDTKADPSETLDSEPVTDEVVSDPAPRVNIDRFAINEGRIRFRDASVDPVAAFELDPFDLTVEPVSLDPERVAEAVFSATFQESALIEMESRLRIRDPLLDTRAEMRISDIPLSVSTPYTLQFIGRPVSEGTFSGDFTYAVADNSLTASNALVVDSIDFGQIAEEYEGTTYPVGMAIALLQNNRNEIAIEIPLSGNMNNPEFKPLGVVRSVITGLLVKAVTSPFNLVSAMTGSVVSGVASLAEAESSETDYSRIAFQAGRYRIEAEAETVLETITEMLESRPRINLGISGSVDPEADSRILQEERFNERLEAFEGSARQDRIRNAYIREILEMDPDAPMESELATEETAETAETAPEPEPEPVAELIPESVTEGDGTEGEPEPQAEPDDASGENVRNLIVTRRGLRKFSRPSAFVQRQAETTEAEPGEDAGPSSSPEDEPEDITESTSPDEAKATEVAEAETRPSTEESPEEEAEAPEPLPELPSGEEMATALENDWFEEPPDLDRLARQRAESVRDYFLASGEIHPDRLELSETAKEEGQLVIFNLKPE
ncbi:MAG: DUF748 domain-containing protein [Oceanipulchritudo sp.]